jgi:superfamily II DNA or RNA helicase
MDFPDSFPNDESASTVGPSDAPLRLRAYQAEMVDESMKSNIICVMDTGSGKTHM